MVYEISFKDISIFSSGGNLFQSSGTVCPILVGGIISNISVKYFEFGLVVLEEMSFKYHFYLELWWPFLFSGAEPFVQVW